MWSALWIAGYGFRDPELMVSYWLISYGSENLRWIKAASIFYVITVLFEKFIFSW